jgi:hypothetical protein
MFQDEWLRAVEDVEREDDPDFIPSSDEDEADSPWDDEEDKQKGEVPKRQDFNVTMICNSRYFYMLHLAKDGNVEQIVDELKMEKERVCGKLLSIIRIFQMFQNEVQAARPLQTQDQPSVSIEKHFSLHCMYICLCQRQVERKLYLLHGFLGQIIHVLAEPDGGSSDEDEVDHDEDKEKGEVPKRQDFKSNDDMEFSIFLYTPFSQR